MTEFNAFGSLKPKAQGMQPQVRPMPSSSESRESLINAYGNAALQHIAHHERRHAWVEIDLSAIAHNVRTIRASLSAGTRFMAVVKADAYGHGAAQVARAALFAGATDLGVATIDEAIALRNADISAPILLLSQPPQEGIPLLLAYDIVPTIYTVEFAIEYA